MKSHAGSSPNPRLGGFRGGFLVRAPPFTASAADPLPLRKGGGSGCESQASGQGFVFLVTSPSPHPRNPAGRTQLVRMKDTP